MATDVNVQRDTPAVTVNKLTCVLCIHLAEMEETVHIQWYNTTHSTKNYFMINKHVRCVARSSMF